MVINHLINPDGKITFGMYADPVLSLNYMDFDLKTPRGLKIPLCLKKIKFNQFHFVGITGPDLMVGLAIVDLKYATNGFFYVYDIKNAIIEETKKTTLPNKHIYISPSPENPESKFKAKGLAISITGNKVYAEGNGIAIDAAIGSTHTTPLRLCTRSGYNGWTYTQKTSPIKISGFIQFKGHKIPISSPSSMAIMDWTGGFMRRDTFWNWAASATTLSDGRNLGFNLACGTNETGFNENAFWIDGAMTTTGSVNFIFNENDMHAPWHIQSNDGKVALIFIPETHRAENINAFLVASKFTQLMGKFAGSLKTNSNEIITLKNCPGWAEDHYAKW
ncbi:MAG: DUF2804 domain-containing protein [Proteobacteria bacterium]|nr:DUF2804 domain-containing protein [Pseudomonadota bacterium]